ncbi:hypothetical protein [uncultured Leifsonia sp.]|uniref:hypothetical protein n=1 Tax=uncultured Leifsonia sp. TaxID=340359 RepID=UPI0025E6C6B7|nr:hypothetical protein [uncultured Leifsonia sp.]
MSRKDLSTLLEKIDTDDVEPLQRQGDASPASDPAVAPQAVAAPEVETPRVKSAPPRKRQPAQAKKTAEPAAAAAPAPVVPAPAGGEPLYLRFVRKETRLREEQYETLTEYARKLNRAKTPGAGERITENTLIRIAIDLLIPHLNELNGNDEAQLRDSVTNRV